MKLKRKESDIYVSISVSLVGFTTLSLIALLSGQASASTYTSDITVAIPASCTISSSNDSYSTTIISGNTGTITGSPVSITCNDASGYAVYAIGYSGDTYSGDYHTDMIASLGSTYNIKTDGTGGASYWKMKLDNTTNVDATIVNGYSDFQVIPASYTKIVSHTTSTATASITPVYQVYIGGNQVAGSYVGKVKYTLLHPNTMTPAESPELAYTINYDANGGTGTMASSTSYSLSDFTLPTSTFTAPSGYRFASWCTTNTAGSYACDGTSYATNASIPAGTVAAGGTLNLYAVWEVPKTYIQDLTLANCPADGMTVYDKRDEKDYTVKLINGECWMTQNLRYLGDTGSSAGTMTIGGNNSNVANKSITLYSLDSSDAGDFGAYTGYCDPTNGYNYACVYDSGSTSTGVWYNYHAASAGTISTDSNDTLASSDICPSGWRLPTGPNTTADTDFNRLVGNTSLSWQNPTAGLTAFGAVAGGLYYNGSFVSSKYGHWWSATASSTANRYTLYYYSTDSQFNGNSSSIRCNGYFVRCVRSS